MNKLPKLFEQARKEIAPPPGEGFEARVMASIRRGENKKSSGSWLDQLGDFFPRLAFVSALFIGLCVLGDLYFSNACATSMTGDLGMISEQWLFAANGN